ncbi:hypothetical protein [Peribacillus simplex]|uniref:hypothetical protein n=1 Tax=Peribacillus simplex TaxID=1478 RepID=UPI003D26F305
MDVLAKIHITKEYIYVFGKIGQQPIKVKNRMNKELDKLAYAVAVFEAENNFRIRGQKYRNGILKEIKCARKKTLKG